MLIDYGNTIGEEYHLKNIHGASKVHTATDEQGVVQRTATVLRLLYNYSIPYYACHYS